MTPDDRGAFLLVAVALRYRVPVRHLRGRGDSEPLRRARRHAVLALRAARLSWPAIGRLMGRDHSTMVVNARRARARGH